MWNSVGRSGHHQRYVGNGADDWNGVSPNGRQYQNEVTQERRDLSGSDYWNLRKQNRPTEEIPAELHFKNSRIKGLQMANIDAYSDKPLPKTTKKTISIRDRICPQQKNYERLEQMQKDLEQDFLAGKIADEEYLSLSAVLDKKLQRSWKLLCRAMSWEDETEEYSDNPCDFTLDDLHSPDNAQEHANNLFLNLTDGNVFKTSYIFIVKLMQIFKG